MAIAAAAETILDVKSAVREAVASLETPGDKQEERQEESVEKKIEKPTEKTQEERDADALEHAQALQLYKALKDPDQREGVIEFIAKQAGYSRLPIETKAELKEAKDEIKGALKEALGDEFDFLSDKLGPALDKIITAKLKDGLAETRAAIEAQEQEKLNSQSEKALVKLSKDFFGEGAELPEAVKKGMSTFMDRVPADPDMSVGDYLEYAFFSTIGKLGLVKKDQKTELKINKNRNDAPSRLASERSTPGSVTPDPSSKILSRKEAIRLAMESIEQQEK